MQEYAGFKKAGNFTLTSGPEVQGELCLNGAATTLNLYSSAFFDPDASPDIFGVFFDRSKVSLINCIKMSARSVTRGDQRYYSSNVFPHFVIFGDLHISSSDRMICEVSFTVDDAATLFYDFDAFGLVIKARPHMERIVETNETGRKIEIGEHPQLFYFTGKHEIFVVNTVIGKISAIHGVSYSFPGPEGIHVDNTIRLNIAFKSRRTIKEAIRSVLVMVKFLEVIAGRPQNISALAFLPVSAGEHQKVLDVYWCMSPRRSHDDESRKPHPAELPIQACRKPKQFTSVLKRWLQRHEEWRNARDRYSTVFAYQNRYGIDRIVGAANMFDIMPSSACQETVVLPSDLKQARDNARKAFKALPASPERDSVLGSLGRIGKAVLKRKVRSRAKLITDKVGERFPKLELVVDQAVDCRNFYVHGSIAKFDYNKHFDQVHFLIDTLEFVFAASDLLESGWDIIGWAKEASTFSHPFGEYLAHYRLRRAA